jgi:hypothetical protein
MIAVARAIDIPSTSDIDRYIIFSLNYNGLAGVLSGYENPTKKVIGEWLRGTTHLSVLYAVIVCTSN